MERILEMPDHRYCDFIAKQNNEYGGYKTGWQLLLDLNKDNVLIIGCNWNSLSLIFAKSFCNITVIETNLNKFEFFKAYFQKVRVDNVRFLYSKDICDAVFPDHYFDLIVLNDNFMYLPEWIKGFPQQVHRDVLKELRRIIKTDGQIYIGTSNRLSYKYILGSKEESTKLPFMTLLPRFASNIYSYIIRKKDYRTYTYTISGYKKLLTNAGFEGIRIYSLLPNHHNTLQILELKNKHMIKQCSFARKTSRILQLAAMKIGLFKYISPSYGIVTSPDSNSCRGFYEHIIEYLGKKQSIKKLFPNHDFFLTKFITSSTKTVILILESKQDKGVVVKLPSNHYCEEGLKKEQERLRQIHDCNDRLGEIKYTIPDSLGEYVYGGWKVYLITACRGEAARSFMERKESKSIFVRSIEYITRLHKATKKITRIDEYTFNKACQSVLNNVKSKLHANDFGDVDFFKQVGEYLKEKLLQREFYMVFTHGDFWLENILINPKNMEITGVVDWCDSQILDLPLIDLVNFYVCTDMVVQKIGFIDAVRNFTGVVDNSSYKKDLILRYLKEFCLDPEDLKHFLILFLIFRINKIVSSKPSLTNSDNVFIRDILDFLGQLNVYPKL